MKKLIMSFSVLCAIIATISFIPFSAVADGDDEDASLTRKGKEIMVPKKMMVSRDNDGGELKKLKLMVVMIL